MHTTSHDQEIPIDPQLLQVEPALDKRITNQYNNSILSEACNSQDLSTNHSSQTEHISSLYTVLDRIMDLSLFTPMK